MTAPRKASRGGFKTVGEVAEAFGATPRTVLYYEELGVMSPRRTARGTRIYSENDMKRFEVAYRMASLGVPLKLIKALATTREAAKTGDEASRKLCAMIDALKGDIERQIRELEKLKQDLDRAHVLVRQCWDCPNKPARASCPSCPCELFIDEAQLLRLTWDPDRPDEGTDTKCVEAGEPDAKCMEAAVDLPKRRRRPRR
jgi:DNA-binding transcriptional MerR regulator